MAALTLLFVGLGLGRFLGFDRFLLGRVQVQEFGVIGACTRAINDAS
jgi:hypothetical protein